MADKLELKVVFSAVDKFLRPVNTITKAAKEASRNFRDVDDALKKFQNTSGKIDGFQKSLASAREASAAYKETQASLAALTQKLDINRVKQAEQAGTVKLLRAEHKLLMREYAAGGDKVAGFGYKFEQSKQALSKAEAEYNRANNATRRLKEEIRATTREVDEAAKRKTRYAETLIRMRQGLREAGIATFGLAQQQTNLKSKIDATSAAAKKEYEAMEAANKQKQRLYAAEANLAKSREASQKWAGTGAKLMAGGAAMSLPVGLSTKAYADFETAMLGVARQVDGARDANGRYTATYFEMGDAIKTMSEKLPMTANEIAKIVEAGARMGIQGKQNLLIFTETTAVMASAFDLPVDQIGEDIGKISQLYKVPIKDIKALGDTINFLDDNALAKGGDIIDVMKRIAGTADMVKMNFKEAAALGSTFLSLGAMPEVAATASNAMIRELSIATMQSKRFLGGLDMLKLKAGDVQLGMNKDATGTILKVLEAIKRLPEEKQLEAATRLFGKEFGDDAAKLASNMDEYRRQLALVNDEKAKGSMQRESDTRNASVNSRMDMAKNALTNIASDLGETLRPALVETLERTLAVVQGVRAWATENPQLAAGLMTVVKYLALGATALGGLVLAVSAVLVPAALLSFQMSMLGLTVSGLAGGALNILMRGIGGVGTAMMWLGRIFMMNPIGLTITAITVGAYLIYKYWDPIKAFFGGLWDQVKQAFNGGLAGIAALILNWGPVGFFYKTFASVMSYFGIELPGKFSEFGANLMSGLGRGILSGIKSARDAIGTAGDAVVSYFKEKLGIHSPSRVFADLGGYLMQGLDRGITGGEDGPLSAVTAMAKKLAGIGAGIAIGGAAIAGQVPNYPAPENPRLIEAAAHLPALLALPDFPALAAPALPTLPGFPALAAPALPTLPGFPALAAPALPTLPGFPALAAPALPTLPGFPALAAPALPTLPGFPALAAPALPTLPGFPALAAPALPTLPGFPALAAPALPTLPGFPALAAPALPTLPGFPALAAPALPTLPGFPALAAPALPTLPGFPALAAPVLPAQPRRSDDLFAALPELRQLLAKFGNAPPMADRPAKGVALDTRPPINPAASMRAMAHEAARDAPSDGSAPMQVTIQIYGAPGQDTSDIQRRVEQALANVESRRAAQQRSRLRDPE